MSTTAQVIVLPREGNHLVCEELSLPDPGPYHVLVRQFASGICHSQLHQMHRERDAHFLMGHESTGVVLATGSKVSHVKEGDRVMVTWVPSFRGDDQEEREIGPVSVVRPDGSPAATSGGGAHVFTWADHTLVDERLVVVLPPDAPTDVTSIIGCAVMTGSGAVINTADVQAGQSVAVFGVGGVGLAAIAAARARAANPIIAVDLSDEKLEFARKFGATHTVNASAGDAVDRVRDLSDGGVDFAFDCIGVKVTMEQILDAIRPGVPGRSNGGTAVLVGVPMGPADLDPGAFLRGEKTYRGSYGGSCRPDRDFPIFLDWHRQGLLDLDALVTARYQLDQINEATDALAHGRIAGRSILEFRHGD